MGFIYVVLVCMGEFVNIYIYMEMFHPPHPLHATYTQTTHLHIHYTYIHIYIHTIDPFNRQPLTLSMVIPDVELKTKIDNWLQEKGIKEINS